MKGRSILTYLAGVLGLLLNLAKSVNPVWKNRRGTKYIVVVHEEPEGGFWAEVPALPGCYSQGESIEELKGHLREAISAVLEVLEELGGKPESNIQILNVAV